MVAAVASALRDSVLDPGAVFVGEVGLGGEVRPVSQLERRLSEASRLGFERAYVAASTDGSKTSLPLDVVPVEDVGALVDELFR